MNVRHIITASAITVASLTGAATVATPAQAAPVPAPPMTVDVNNPDTCNAVSDCQSQVTAFWQFLNALQNHVGECENIRESASGQPHQVTYGGSCLQAFLNALYTPGLAWVYIDGPDNGSAF